MSRRVFVATDVRLHRDSSGAWRASHSAAAYEGWSPYVAAFGQVELIARHDPITVKTGLRADGPGVVVRPVPDYVGLRQLLIRVLPIGRAVFRLGGRGDVFIGRLPEPLSLITFVRSRVVGGQFIALVVAEPAELLKVLRHGLTGRVLAVVSTRLVRLVIKRSDAVIYVSQHWLQGIYPPPPGTPSLGRSNVRLDQDAFVERVQSPDNRSDELRLVAVGSLQAQHKGHDMLVRVVRSLAAMGLQPRLRLIGGGRLSSAIEGLAAELGVSDRVELLGQIHDVKQLRRELDAADIFVSGSRSEGLPRATVEAMARSLPVISTRAGATFELVDDSCLVEVDDVAAMTSRIAEVAQDQARSLAIGSSNLRRARQVAALAEPQRLSQFLKDVT